MDKTLKTCEKRGVAVTSKDNKKGGSSMRSEAQKRAEAKYEREKTVQVKLKLVKATDADIIDKLDRVGNKQGYLKRLVRDDIQKGGNA